MSCGSLKKRPKLVQSIIDALTSGASHSKRKGWRAIEFGVSELGSRNEHFRSLLCQDTKELLGLFAGQSSVGATRIDTEEKELAMDASEKAKRNATRAL